LEVVLKLESVKGVALTSEREHGKDSYARRILQNQGSSLH
jgi:hypothetical protein